MVLVKFILAIVFLSLSFNRISMLEFQFDRIDILNSTYREGFYNISQARITKFNRTTYVFNAVMEWFIDLDDDVSSDITIHFNRFNNNQYSKTPMHVKRQPFYKIVDKFYVIIFAQAMEKKQMNVPLKKAGEPVRKVRTLQFKLI